MALSPHCFKILVSSQSNLFFLTNIVLITPNQSLVICYSIFINFFNQLKNLVFTLYHQIMMILGRKHTWVIMKVKYASCSFFQFESINWVITKFRYFNYCFRIDLKSLPLRFIAKQVKCLLFITLEQLYLSSHLHLQSGLDSAKYYFKGFY